MFNVTLKFYQKECRKPLCSNFKMEREVRNCWENLILSDISFSMRTID